MNSPCCDVPPREESPGWRPGYRGTWHRCSACGLYYKPRQLPKNSPLVRRLARIYTQQVGEEFPGGETNAYVCRTYAGYWQRSLGAKVWCLDVIEYQNPDGTLRRPVSFGSIYPAKESARDPWKIEVGW